MHRVWAIIERDLRRFRRSPSLIITSLLMPVIQLVVLGHAFGGKITNLELGVVDQDHHVPAVKLQAMFNAIAANAKTFETVSYVDEAAALKDLRNGRINGVVTIPPHFSRDLASGNNPKVALIEDNTDQFSSSALAASMTQLLGAFNGPAVPPRTSAAASLAVVELYPYVPFVQFFLPGTIVLAIFVSAMIGGGIIYIDDKAAGLHEGYLVTPIRKFELILGFNLAGVIKACFAGAALVIVGSLVAGIPDPLNIARIARMLVLVLLTALALISMMFLLMVRVADPLIPRMIFGVLNVLLFFPSGAVYPTNGFPVWMKAIAKADPFTYAVHGFKEVVLKNTGLAAVWGDMVYLVVFTVIAMSAATVLFKRTL